MQIAQSMSVGNKPGAGPMRWDHLIDHSIAPISDLASKLALLKYYMTAKTIHDGRKLKAAYDEFGDVSCCWMKNRINKTATHRMKYF